MTVGGGGGGAIRTEPSSERANEAEDPVSRSRGCFVARSACLDFFRAWPKKRVDAQWYIDYALSVFHESQFPPGRTEIAPLHPLWLNLWMNVGSGTTSMTCIVCATTFPTGTEGNSSTTADITACRHLDNIGFRIQVTLGPSA